MPGFEHSSIFGKDARQVGLTRRQSEVLLELVDQALRLVEHPDDDRPKHVALMVFTRIGEADDDHVATNIMTTMDKDWLQTLIRDWLHRDTH